MGIEKTYDDVRWLRSRPTQGGYATDKIDAEAGIIRDVVMVQEGEAKGHGVHLDADFIKQLVAYDQQVFGDRGHKARFGHPSASNNTMGTQMGMFKNIRSRKQGDKMQAIGDLHLMEAAEVSPTHPGMRSWMLKMAKEQPEFVMSSIVFQAAAYFQRKANGHKRYIKSESEVDPELGEIWVEFGETGQHYYTDMVEAGAATDSLFSNQVNPHLFVAQADQFLSENPAITQFIKSHPEKVIAFFATMGIQLTHPPKKMAPFNMFKWLTGESVDAVATEDLDALRTALSAAQTDVTALAAAKEAAENRVEELTADIDTLTTSLRASQEEVKALGSQVASLGEEIDQLKAEPADNHTGGDHQPDGSGPVRSYHQSEVYQRAKKFATPKVK